MATANSINAATAPITSYGLQGPDQSPTQYAPYTSPYSVNINRNDSRTYSFPEGNPKYYMQLNIMTYKRLNLLRMAAGTNIASMRLPLPTNIVDNHQVSYTKTEIGTVVGTAVSGDPASIAQATALAGVKGGTAAASTLLNFIGRVPGVGAFAAGALSGENVLGAVQAMAGVAPNPFVTILLKGPEYKVHNFTWRLTPNSDRESREIREIIAQLNNSMAPSYAAGGIAFFGFPNVFNISFVPNEHMLYRFKPAVLQQLQVNYTPSGSPAFYKQTAAPDAVDITAQFLELEYWINGQFG